MANFPSVRVARPVIGISISSNRFSLIYFDDLILLILVVPFSDPEDTQAVTFIKIPRLVDIHVGNEIVLTGFNVKCKLPITQLRDPTDVQVLVVSHLCRQTRSHVTDRDHPK